MMIQDFYRNKRVVVPGATGLIGSYVVKILSEWDANVKAIYLNRPPNEFTNLADEVIKADLFDLAEARMAFRGNDVVANCAGITGGIGARKDDPVSFIGPATALEATIIHACYLEKVDRHGYLSSTTVYPMSNLPLREEESFDILGVEPYQKYHGIATSKRYLEKLCQYYYETVGLKVGIIRPTGAYGRYDDFNEISGHVIPSMIIRALRSEEKFTVWGNGSDVRDFPHASDVAMGFLEAMAVSPNGQPFNIGSGKPVTTLELAKIILSVISSDIEIVTDTTKPTAIPIRIVDLSRAKTLLNYEPSISLKDGIKDTINWIQR
jgi:GDP-L-fucose synthase